jgi:hypothetical protein
MNSGCLHTRFRLSAGVAGLMLVLLLANALNSAAQEAPSSAPSTSSIPTPPPYCHPCLFYGGNFDSKNPNSNALQNELTTSVVSGAAVFVPFVVPFGKKWTIYALFSNNLSYTEVIDPEHALWSISKDMSQGSEGTVVADGAAPATYKPTGRGGFGMREFTLLATIDPPVTLTSGEYRMKAEPECTNAADRACDAAAYYLSDVEDVPRQQATGREPIDQSYYDSGIFGYFFWPTWGSSGACQGVGCDRFSAGAIGTEEPE